MGKFTALWHRVNPFSSSSTSSSTAAKKKRLPAHAQAQLQAQEEAERKRELANADRFVSNGILVETVRDDYDNDNDNDNEDEDEGVDLERGGPTQTPPIKQPSQAQTQTHHPYHDRNRMTTVLEPCSSISHTCTGIASKTTMSLQLCILLVLAIALLSPSFCSAATKPKHSGLLPNILLLLTDDQDAIVGGMAHMPQLRTLLQERGVTFDNAFVHTPICCPSRSSILTGRYLHNGGALNNTVQGNCNGQAWQQTAEPTTFAALLQAVGYKTSYAGKYLNMYGIPGSPNCQHFPNGTKSAGCRRVPPGWDRWLGLIGNSQYYNYSVVQSLDGGKTPAQEIRHGQDYHQDYLPDLVANFTLDSIHAFADDNQQQQQQQPQQPFLAVVAWPTAHMPFTPAPWAQAHYTNATILKTPNYNASVESLQSKHWMMRWLAPIDSATETWMNAVYQNRTQALLSVDHHIALLVQALQKRGLEDNTWIIYTSDNGWQLGQHRLTYDKRQLYEHDIRVPFIVTGPGVLANNNTTSHEIVLNVDIAPTMLDMVATAAAAAAAAHSNVDIESLQALQNAAEQMDGTSFLPAIIFGSHDNKDMADRRGEESTGDNIHNNNNDNKTRLLRSDFLVSYHGRGYAQCDNFWDCSDVPSPGDPHYHMGDWSNNTYHCVRTISQNDGENTMYCRFLDEENFVEYYDIDADPWQLSNAYDSLTVDQKIRYERRLEELRLCKGKSCRQPSPSRNAASTVKSRLDNVEVTVT